MKKIDAEFAKSQCFLTFFFNWFFISKTHSIFRIQFWKEFNLKIETKNKFGLYKILILFFFLLTAANGCVQGKGGSLKFMGILGPFGLVNQPSNPISLNYSDSPYVMTRDAVISEIAPEISGEIQNCTVNPPLPTGLVLNQTDCSLSGIPNVEQAATEHSITASNEASDKTSLIIITVDTNPPAAFAFASPAIIFTKNAPTPPLRPSVRGTVTSCSSDIPLPLGLSLDPNCMISGTPTVPQPPTTYTITASNAFGNTTTTISIVVNETAPTTLIYAGSPFVFSKDAPIATQTPTFTGTVTSCTTDIPLPTGLSIHNSTCAISGTPTVTQVAANYVVTASNVYGSTTATISITVNMAAPSSLNYVGSPFVFTQNSTISTVTPTFTGSVTNCVTDIALPTGMGINSTTCAISGTPTTTQTATNYVVTASNASGNATTTISIEVNMAPPSALNYVGSPFLFTRLTTIPTLTPTVSGTVTNCTTDVALPPGLSIHSTTCAISGTPTGLQAATDYVVTASNSSGNTTKTVKIMIVGPPPQKSLQTQCWNSVGTLDATCSLASSLGQDGQLQNGSTPSFTGPSLVNAPDFITVNNITGQIWKTCHQGRKGIDCATADGSSFFTSRAAGSASCAALNALNSGAGYANLQGWRLPTISELETLVDFNNSSGTGSGNPKTFLTAFPNTDAGYYYLSSNAYVPTSGIALALYFSNGSTTWVADDGSSSTRVRCVTSAP
ncbi:putative Ig domain-containing protein [Leptospira sp. 201903070]|uniref:Ig domain-containing protein n=1 Tax=Leptospira ainlahdjerensis TaxID=2810033 RepID=A0ABS2U898_9LEPT|nr:putative Ig domain-containing protein [Leptospira ainlahdjerensis]MBM9576591.1 putative Ig domain-containing protein [Leptospira ainlahdjerensis]